MGMDPQTIKAAQDALKSAPNGIYSRVVSVEPVRKFFAKGKFGVADSLQQCLGAGYRPLFMPELAKTKTNAGSGSRLWQVGYVTPSMRATGQTKQGAKVVVYVHQPHFYSNPANIRNAVEEGTLKNGAGPLPQAHFDKLVDLNGNGRVFVVDYDTLRRSSSGGINVENALAHPQTIPFLGGEAIAQAYLAKYKEVYGNRIGIWHYDDFDTNTPRGRVLFLGYGGSSGGGLGGYSLGYVGRVLGVAPEAQSVEKNAAPSSLEAKVETLVLRDGKVLKHDGKTYILAPEGIEL